MTELRADRYHAGVRWGTLGVWAAAALGVYLVARTVAAAFTAYPDSFWPVLGLVAVFGGQACAWLGERWLLQNFPSGRSVWLAPGRLEWRVKAAVTAFELGVGANFWRWRFVIRGRRGGRVPNGHHCFALRLVRGQDTLSLYSFLPPAQADSLATRWAFYELRAANQKTGLPLGGRDAIYLAAENARWQSGAELTPADFETLLAHLDRHLPEFAARPAS